MKYIAFALLILVPSVALGQNPNFPVTIHVLWDMNADSDAVITYGVQLDTNPVTVVLPNVDCVLATRTCSSPIVVPDNNDHTVAVTASNQYGISPPTAVTFRVNNPKKPTNVRIGP